MQKIFRRINQYLFFVILVTAILYFGKTFLIPLTLASLLAMLMAPVCRKLDKIGFPRPLSAACCILILVSVLAGIVLLVRAQIVTFTKDISLVEKKAHEVAETAKDFIEKQFGVSEEKQTAAIKKQSKSAGNSAPTMIKKILSGVSTTIATIVLTMVFTFLFLFGKEKYEEFFIRLFRNQDSEKVKAIVDKVTTVGQKYLTGRAMSVTIIAVLYSIGLSIVGIKSAIILACLAALMTVIPFVGTALGGIFPVLMALVTEDSLQPALLVVVVIFSIQTMDNYFIEPNVVGGEVNLSALFSILSVLTGGVLWGPAGMILFLPMLGIVKIVCDNIPVLQPIGFLIGDQREHKESRVTAWFKSVLHKRKPR
jgi:predicted PurR-regulated permease PerM